MLRLADGVEVAVRYCGAKLPEAIDEKWREAYLDVTAPMDLDSSFSMELCQWLNREQPISLAMNCDTDLALELFENTALVVYTLGNVHDKVPALTAQARPQDGECFGEFPARKHMDKVTAFPVIIPSSTPGYNSAYTLHFLGQHGAAPAEEWGLPGALEACHPLLTACRGTACRGYCRILLEYLADAAVGPRQGCGARTSLFGLQRPPLRDGLCCIRLPAPPSANVSEDAAADILDEAILHILPFVATTAKPHVVVSVDPALSEAASRALGSVDVKVLYEDAASFSGAEDAYWNVVSLAWRTAPESRDFPLVAHFTSRLFPMGHVKSTLSDDKAFLARFADSPKWLRLAGPRGDQPAKRSRI